MGVVPCAVGTSVLITKLCPTQQTRCSEQGTPSVFLTDCFFIISMHSNVHPVCISYMSNKYGFFSLWHILFAYIVNMVMFCGSEL